MATQKQHRVVCVGGGYGNLTAISQLLRYRNPQDGISITLIDPQAYQESRSEIDTVVAFGTNPDFVRIWFKDIYRGTDVCVVQGAMDGLDTKNHTVRVSLNNGQECDFSYDTLVLGLGAEASMPPIKGLRENALAMWSLRDLEVYRQEIEDRVMEAVYEGDAQKRRDLLTFSIVGAGATGIEVVGPLVESMRRRCVRTGLDMREVTINLLDGTEHVLQNNLSPDQQVIADEYIKNLGVNLFMGSFVDEVTEDEIILQNGTRVKSGLLLFAGGAKTPEYVCDWGLPTDRCRIVVNDDLTVASTGTESGVDVTGIYALGDCAAQTFEGETMPHALLAQHAMHQGIYVAKNIIADIRGTEHKTYGGTLLGQLVSVGSRYAIGWIPGMNVRGSLAILIKHSSFALYWYYCGGPKFAAQRWMELARMTRYATTFPSKPQYYFK